MCARKLGRVKEAIKMMRDVGLNFFFLNLTLIVNCTVYSVHLIVEALILLNVT